MKKMTKTTAASSARAVAVEAINKARSRRTAPVRRPEHDQEVFELLEFAEGAFNPLELASDEFLFAATHGNLDCSDDGFEATECLELRAAQALDIGLLAELELMRRSLVEVGAPHATLASTFGMLLRFVQKHAANVAKLR